MALGVSLLALVLAAGSPVTLEDLLSIKDVGSPTISPDGRSVVFTVIAWEERDEKRQSVSHVFRVPADGGSDAVQLTFGEKGETAPQFSPDGRWISFLSARGGGLGAGAGASEPKPQLWLLPTTGGEGQKLTDAKGGVTSYTWSRDGATIAFISPRSDSDEEEAAKKRGDDEKVYEGDEPMAELWTTDVATREAARHTDGARMTVKGPLSFSPDGTKVAFTGAPTIWIRDGRDDVYVVTLDGDRIEKITDNSGPDGSPAFSPDGKWIAFAFTPNESEPLPDGTYTRALRNQRLGLYDVASGAIMDLSRSDFDLIPSGHQWTPDSKRLVLSVGERAYREVYAYDIESKGYSRLTEHKVIGMGTFDRAGARVAFTMQSALEPEDVYVADASFTDMQKLTEMNPQAADFALGGSEVITWKSTDGFEVEGVLLKPVGYEEGQRYPLLVVAHGGPTGAHHNDFRVRYGDGGQHWAGQGWAVLYPNPRGSTNYGEAFMRANLADWGGGDYRDIMTGVDALVARGLADPERLAVQGWSYGGYMTCWTVSQTTRFKAAMIGAGLTNLVSMYGTNDIPNYLGTFFNGTLSPETEQLYRERSGLTYADDVRTPTLLLHGGNDERVPIGQPMEFFRALKDRGIETELVFYPREGHGLREYYHRLDRLKRQYEWITRHTLGGSSQATSN